MDISPSSFMGINTENRYGSIDISCEAIATVAGKAAIECYGVLGLASKNSLRENINELLKKEDYVKGVYARKKSDGVYAVDLYICCAYGVKLTEVCAEVQKKVKFVLEETFTIPFKEINVLIQDVSDIE